MQVNILLITKENVSELLKGFRVIYSVVEVSSHILLSYSIVSSLTKLADVSNALRIKEFYHLPKGVLFRNWIDCLFGP
jgi:hypothetical protein